jgi:hypothetical protein
MGLGFHADGFEGDRPHWSYGGFMRFREKLAALYGIELRQMVGFGAEHQIEWGGFEKADLYPLLNHSDCEGDLHPTECTRVARGLKEAIANWEFHEDMPNYDYDLEHMKLLQAMCEWCAYHHKKLVFC